jgi:hypothetical protein
MNPRENVFAPGGPEPQVLRTYEQWMSEGERGYGALFFAVLDARFPSPFPS